MAKLAALLVAAALLSVAVAQPVSVTAPATDVKVAPGGGAVAVAAPGTTVTVNAAGQPVAKTSGKPATARAAPVKQQAPQQPPVAATVRAPTTGVDVAGENVAAAGVWGSVVRTPAGVAVNVPFFSGVFPGSGRRMLRA